MYYSISLSSSPSSRATTVRTFSSSWQHGMSRHDGKYSVGRTNMTSVGGEKWHTGYDVVVVKKPTALPPHSLGLLLSLSLSESYIIRSIMDIDYYSIYWDLCGYWLLERPRFTTIRQRTARPGRPGSDRSRATPYALDFCRLPSHRSQITK